MPNYAVVDLGSNSIRLVVYEVKDDCRNAYTNRDFKSLINDKVMAGLAAFVVDGVFTEAGLHRAIGVLKGHAKRARHFDCKRIDIFATAVLRNALNCAEVVSTIEEETGMPIALLSSSDEAHLGFVGATCDRVIERGTLIDIGGGSTELTRIENGCDFNNASIGQGSLSSYSSFVSAILPNPEEMNTIAQAFRTNAASLVKAETYRAKTLYGVGGSVRAVAKMQMQVLNETFRTKTLTDKEIRAVLNLCCTNPNAFAHLALRSSAERIHTLTPGCIILDVLMSDFGGKQLVICKYGVREGYLIERMLTR